MTAKPDIKKIPDEDFALSKECLDEIHRRCVEIDSYQTRLIDNTSVLSELRMKYLK